MLNIINIRASAEHSGFCRCPVGAADESLAAWHLLLLLLPRPTVAMLSSAIRATSTHMRGIGLPGGQSSET